MKVKIILNEDFTKDDVLHRLNGTSHGNIFWEDFDPDKFYKKRGEGKYTLLSQTNYSWYIGYSNEKYVGCKISVNDGEFSEPIISKEMNNNTTAEQHCVDFINEIIDYINSQETYELDLDDIII